MKYMEIQFILHVCSYNSLYVVLLLCLNSRMKKVGGEEMKCANSQDCFNGKPTVAVGKDLFFHSISVFLFF